MDTTAFGGTLQQVVPVGYLFWIPLLPLLGAAYCALFGWRAQKIWGHRGVDVVAIGVMAGAFVVSALAVFGGLLPQESGHRFLYDHVFSMMHVGSLEVNFDLAMDPLGGVMALVVTGVGTLIHVYSAGYMHEEPSYWRFFAYLNLFCFAMLLLVLSDNFLLMFFGWEGVGLCSYLLIGFWYKDLFKARCGMKAFIVNRIGDFGFVVGLMALFWGLGGSWQDGRFVAHAGDRIVLAQHDPRLAHGPAHAAEADSVAERQGEMHGDAGTRLQVAVFPGARVLIDGREAGTSPLVVDAAPGRVRLELVRDDGRRIQTEGAIAAGATTSVVLLGSTVSFRQIDDQLRLEQRGVGTRWRVLDLFRDKTIFGLSLVTFACLCFFVGATGKSAQIPLYTWLPDAMAGPTPVSALIHAATMVTAGVYMVARLNFLFSLSAGAMSVVAGIGVLTALFAATIGFFQYDIKKVLAYSTVSQLGFMFLAVGVGAYWAGIFHLVTHAFFKACLFLGSGSVIHGMHHAVDHHDPEFERKTQDLREMGGLGKRMPYTAKTYFIACLAITAAPIPLLAGFWSKDEILWKAFTSESTHLPGALLWGLAVAAAAGTAFYMWRSYFLAFTGEPRKETEHVHESPKSMTYVLVALAGLSIVGGLLGLPHWLTGGEPWLESFLAPVLASSPVRPRFREAGTALEIGFMALSVVIALGGWLAARFFYDRRTQRKMARIEANKQRLLPIWTLLHNKYYVDELYDRTFVRGFLALRAFLGQFDKWVIDGLVNFAALGGKVAAWIVGKVDQYGVDGLVNLLANGVLAGGRRLRGIQTGQIQAYLGGALAGVFSVVLVRLIVPEHTLAGVLGVVGLVAAYWVAITLAAKRDRRQQMARLLIAVAAAGLVLGAATRSSYAQTAPAPAQPRLEIARSPIELPARGGTAAFTLRNAGTAQLVVQQIALRQSLADAHRPARIVAAGLTLEEVPAPFTLGAGESRAVEIRWNPAAGRARQAFTTVVVRSNDPRRAATGVGVRTVETGGASIVTGHLLSWIVFFPLGGMVLIVILFAAGSRSDELVRWVALGSSAVPLLLGLYLLRQYVAGFSRADGNEGMQFVEHVAWIKAFNVEYYLGVDGVSISMVLLTVLISFVGVVVSWNIGKQVKGYFAMYLLLETGMLGVFVSLDFFLFYVFWEVMLLPMYFLIGIWGGPRKEYAAIKFFLYTLFGSVLMLLALIALYLNSGPSFLADGTAVRATFSMTEMVYAAYGAQGLTLLGMSLVKLAWVALFIGFAIKIPMFPFHTWLPDAHVEAPTAISVILAGVLLKMGTYGIFRINFAILPEATRWAAPAMAVFGVINIVYGAFCAMAQTDLKKLVAYSSVSHMGYCLLGMSAFTSAGMNGAMLQMFNHGTITAMLFTLVGVIYDRVHTRDLDKFGGLASEMPLYTALFGFAFMASLGLPGLSGFISEALCFLGAFPIWRVLTIIAASGVIITAAYHLVAIQKIFLGKFNESWRQSKYLEAFGGTFPETNAREVFSLAPLVIIVILLGFYPHAVLNLIGAGLDDLRDIVSPGGAATTLAAATLGR